jgi:AcrR family transcriptional regulator
MQSQTTKELRRTQQREAIRMSILEAARDALIEGGIETFSMRKLALAVGYSPGAIYLYFKTKEDLLESLVEDAFARLLDVLDEVHDEVDVLRSLRNKLHAYVDFGLRFPNHYHLAFVRRPTARGVTQETRPHGAFEVLRRGVRQCIEAERFSSTDVEATSQVLWATIHGITSLLIALPKFPWVDRERLIGEVVDTALRGLQTPAARVEQRGERDDR